MPTLATLKVFLDSLEEGVLFLDAGRRILEANTAAAVMVGKRRGAILERLCPTLFADTACARACEVQGHCVLAPSAGESGRVQDIVLKGGGEKIVSLRMWAMLLPPNDSHIHCAVILRDRSREVELEAEVRERWQLGGLVGRAPVMQDLYRNVLRAATSGANVLVTGESGVGKELVARALHDNSPRGQGPYVAVHCAALADNLLESELFGHAKGAFSGAGGARIGRFEAANGGTLLLDEIGEISLVTQTKLLRVIQEREVVRVGENHPRKIDVRVIAATHRDLDTMVKRGEFREDLYYRLRVLPLRVPALREHRGDISLLASQLLNELAERYQRPTLRLSQDAMLALESYDWPGNVRQLFNALEYAVVQSDGTTIQPRHLLAEVTAGNSPKPVSGSEATASFVVQKRNYRPVATAGDERAQILRVLAEVDNNKAEAARRLGMSRTTLWKRLRPPR